MKHRIALFGAVATLALFGAITTVARGDAASDLAAGRKALAAGELDQAKSLLATAAQALPESVEAQLAWAEFQLKSGQIDAALDGYRKVLKLSPEHVEAKRLVTALTGKTQSISQRLAAAEELIRLAAMPSAEVILLKAIEEPISDQQRLQARLLLSRARLWNGATDLALADAIRLVQDAAGTPQAVEAHAVAVLAMLAKPDNDAKTAELLARAPEVKVENAAWKPWLELAGLVLQLTDESKSLDVSAKLAQPLATLPESNYRNALLDRLLKTMLTAAQHRFEPGDGKKAFLTLLPLVSDSPATDDLWKKDIRGGWLGASVGSAARRLQVAKLMAQIGLTTYQRQHSDEALRPCVVAAKVLRQNRDDEPSYEYYLQLADSLAGLSRPATDRKAGAPLSAADTLQAELLSSAIPRARNEAQRTKIVELMAAQIDRYQRAGDLETGLKQVVVINPADLKHPLPMVMLVPAYASLPRGAAQSTLYRLMARSYAALGLKTFNAAAATPVGLDSHINTFDAAALQFCSIISGMQDGDPAPAEIAHPIIERYIAANQWKAAAEGMSLMYTHLRGDAGRWAEIQFQLRQAQDQEQRLLAANRRLGDELSPLLKEALLQIRQATAALATDSSRNAAIPLLDAVVNRYAAMERTDLAEAAIALIDEPPAKAELSDWALFRRADLLERQADRAIKQAAEQSEDTKTLSLEESHKNELTLLNQLIDTFPKSAYAAQAVNRVTAIAARYLNLKAFTVSQDVLTDFIKAHPKLATAEALEFQVVQVALAKSQAAFTQRKDKIKPPDKLLAESVVAIDALVAFLKAHPSGQYAPTAEQTVLDVARAYGQAGAWPVAREVLARFAAAMPDYRSPGHLKFLEAATYLGELDSAYGLQLLSPPAPVGKPGEQTALAMTEDSVLGGRWRSAVDPAKNAELTGLRGIGGSAAGIGDKSEPIAQPGSGATGAIADNGPFDRAAKSSFGPPVTVPAVDPEPAAKPSDTALALVRQADQQNLLQIALLKERFVAGNARDGNERVDIEAPREGAIALPAGTVISEAEMTRQDAAADKAFAILLELAKKTAPAEVVLAEQSRQQICWMFGFFEGQTRTNRAMAMIQQFLKDRPNDRSRVALQFRAVTDQLSWAGQLQPKQRLDQKWIDEHHLLFDAARAELNKFIKAQTGKADWANQARLLLVESYDRESKLAAPVSKVRSGGLLVRAADALIELLQAAPDHPDTVNFPAKLWAIAERLRAIGQEEQSIFVLGQIPKYFPTDARTPQSILRIAEEYAAHLANPLKAVETYQEYLSLVGENDSIRSQIFIIGQQLNAKQRFLESLHVLGVFVDSFPSDVRAAEALRLIGLTHQSNEAWDEAIAAYQRIVSEYPASPLVPQIKLAVAECHINLSHWRKARELYNEYMAAYPQDAQVAMCKSRIEILKSIDRYQLLLSDDKVQRNKDDAQFQIGRIVNEQLQNPIKAIAEFRKVVANFPKSDLADDAQFEIGKALLGMNRLDQAREELLRVPKLYPTSPLADDALFLVGQTYERAAVKLASVTVEKARAEAYEDNQRSAYRAFRQQNDAQGKLSLTRRDELKKAGKTALLALEEASAAATFNGQLDTIGNATRGAELKAETESALQVANRQDKINDAYRQSVAMYARVAAEYPLGDMTDKSLLRMAQILETELKDRKASMKTYQDIVKYFPGTPVAEDAAWKVASFYDQEGKYDEAVKAYREFIRTYPASVRVPDAQYSLAESLEQLGRWIEAMDAYETFRQKFNSHPKAQTAQEQINWIKAYRK